MSDLITDFALGAEGDAFYDALIAAHEGLSEPESHSLNARLVLILANQIGDADVLAQATMAAKDHE